ncbi:MAG: proline--tRNA ligase [Sulfolobales archaeon]
MSEDNVYRDLGRSFSEWFDYVLEVAEVYDYGRYPVKGMGVWLPYGFKIRENTINILRGLLDSTGHEEILLPLLIPENIIEKESEHIRGFEDQVYWVTHGGLEPLDIKLALRPTSETSLTYLESFWVKSYKQLPKKYYQIVSIFRYETKATRAMIRVREVSTFKEAHTLHEDFNDCERQVVEAIDIYSKFFDSLGVPYLISKRPEWDKFAGAIYTIAFDTLLPDGRALQIGTVHNLGQNFTKVFEVRIQKSDGSIDYGWQTSYGISERALASMFAVHGDRRGLVLPFHIAPIQIVIIPLITAETKDEVFKYSAKIREALVSKGYKVYEDLRDELRPGEKFYYWEFRGVPLRIEIGIKEVEGGYVTVFRRDTLERVKIGFNELLGRIESISNEYNNNLRSRAWQAFKSRITRFTNIEDARKFLSSSRGIIELPWCGRQECGLKLIETLDCDALGTPLGIGVVEDNCVVCGAKANTFMRLAKKY